MSSPSITSLICYTPICYSRSTLRYVAEQTMSYLSGTANVLNHTTANVRQRLRCIDERTPRLKEHTDISQNDIQLNIWTNASTGNEDTDDFQESHQVQTKNQIKKHIDTVRSMLVSMEDGEISSGAYDMAWVALIEDIHGKGGPQFPLTLEWIANNQLADGSWGDRYIFEAQDRLISTLACIVALKTWNIHPGKTQKGILFVKENLCKLEDINAEHRLTGFEIAFPSLMNKAQKLGIVITDDSPALQEIYARRNLKLAEIPSDVLHTIPTTLLFSIEGMSGLEWEKLLKLQFDDGSFFFSPSATAFAFMHTKDENCFRYLSKTVERFNGGVPFTYPIDLFEHIWVVDKLERLGISRYFSTEIKGCVDYVDRYWTKDGICSGRNSRVTDIDDTAMSFRLLRLHGRNVSAEVFRNFQMDGEFFCFAGQSTISVTTTFNLYRASQLLFPGESVLEDAKIFSSKLLREKQASNDLLDKWIIAKDLPSEVSYALEVPWYASLPRVEAPFYLEQYGGEDDVWLGKTLYRMPYLNNNTYLELAKLDYNNCQALHQVEWNSIQKWYKASNLGEYGMSQKRLLLAYFLAAASIFEPERWNERVAWAKTAVLVETIRTFFENNGFPSELKKSFVNDFRNNGTQLGSISKRQFNLVGDQEVAHGETLLKALNLFILEVQVEHGRDIDFNLRHAWEMWITSWQEESYEHGSDAELLLNTLYLCGSNHRTNEQISSTHLLYRPLFDITKRVCQRICQGHQELQLNKAFDGAKNKAMVQIDSDMQKLVELVVSPSSDGMVPQIKQIFLIVAKTYYYTAYIAPSTVESHIAKVLFEKVDMDV